MNRIYIFKIYIFIYSDISYYILRLNATVEHQNIGAIAANIQSRWCLSAIEPAQAYQRDLDLAKGSNSGK